MLHDLAAQVVAGESLARDQAYQAANLMLDEEIDAIKATALLVAMRTRGESPEEMLGFINALKEHALTVQTDLPVLDTCGTGGDGLHTFNISTAVALVVASCGVPVAKHGNRAMSSRVGSADVLEALGIRIDLSPDEARQLLEDVGFTFFFAPIYHPILRNVSGLRRNLGIPTLFNFLGPLLNPCPLTYQLIGVSAANMQETIAKTLVMLGRPHALVVRGEDGLDEISPCSATRVLAIHHEQIQHFHLDPQQLGMSVSSLSLLRGADAPTNARIIIEVLKGNPGPYRNTVLINVIPALVLAGKARDYNEASNLAAEAIDSGKAYALLQRLIRTTRDGNFTC